MSSKDERDIKWYDIVVMAAIAIAMFMAYYKIPLVKYIFDSITRPVFGII